MISRKSTFFLGIFIFLVPFFGLPSFWKTLFVALSGITLVFLSIKITIPKKSIKNKIKKEKVTPVYVENIPVYYPPVNEPEPVIEVAPTVVQKAPTRRRASTSKSSANKIV